MITFKSTEDLSKLPPDHPALRLARNLVLNMIDDYPEYKPENDGYLVILDRSDVDRVLDDLDMPHKLSEVQFEGVTTVDGYFLAVYLPNNQFGLDFLIPDEPWLPVDVRRHLELHLDD